jgi:hypothetical protein
LPPEIPPPPFPVSSQPQSENDRRDLRGETGSPPPFPGDPFDKPRTQTSFNVTALNDEYTVGPEGLAAVRAANERLRHPAPRRRRPTLLPDDAPPSISSPSRTKNSALLMPVEPNIDSSKPDLNARAREVSDVIHSFDSDSGAGPAPLVAQPPRLQQKSHSGRRPPRSRARPAPRPHPVARPGPRPVPAPSAGPYSPFPFNPDHLAVQIAEQRRRLHVLDGFSRVLEGSAVILGTLALACMVAAVVSILVGSDVSVLAASGALIGAGAALGVTLLMVVASIGLRQIAHTSAQLAALLESLSTYRR